MTKVIGQIESLKRLKSTLRQKGINRFNSVGDIHDFIKNYEQEKQHFFYAIEKEVDTIIEEFKANKVRLEEEYYELKTNTSNQLNSRILRLQSKCDYIQSRNANNPLTGVLNALHHWVLVSEKSNLAKNFDRIIHRHTYRSKALVFDTINKLDDYLINREKIISSRREQKLKELAYTRNTIEELNSLIAGAIGENLVVNELEKLSDQYVLFNNYSIVFDKPIFNNKNKYKIFRIQVDHLLVSQAGLFVIETKNWSKKSIRNPELRSPINQIEKSSYALYFTLTNSIELKSKFNNHHWGESKIPIRSIVVMIKEKPKANFKYVKVLTLKDLNSYIHHFEPIFNNSEVLFIANYLQQLSN